MNEYDYSPADSARRAAKLVAGMMDFWKDAHGWAPIEAAQLLNKSMLEWQTSLAACLPRWTEQLTDGELILGWANIGAIVEGQLKLFLSIYYADYSKTIDSAIKFNKKGKKIDPDGLSMEPLRQFFQKNIWPESNEWNDWISHVQLRRNAIHAFQAKQLGDSQELHQSLQILLNFIRMINSRLPYPDESYVPKEY
jgi:hypothetical protein